MKAVILAAGRGTRMEGLTDDRPKPMLAVGGRPILEHVLDRLSEAGFSEALIVTGYPAEMIEEHLRAYPLPLVFCRQTTINGTATAALLALQFAGTDPFLLTFGDILVEARVYREMASMLEGMPEADAIVGVRRVDDPYQGAAVYEDNGIVTRIVEKPPRGTSTTPWNSAGLYVFRESVFPELERVPLSMRGEYELTSAVAQLIDSGRRLLLYSVQGSWRDIGRPEDLAAVRSSP